MDERRWDLCKYRMEQARESLEASRYALKAVLATEEKDFKRHKDVVAYFNKVYVATGKFPSELGRMIAKLQQARKRFVDYVAIRNTRIKEQNIYRLIPLSVIL